jgi:SPP1 gp7 family putative phage head morphogenesis protein
LQAIYAHTCPKCSGVDPHGSAGDESPEMAREAARVARGIYTGNITQGTIDPALTKLVAQELRKAVIEGFGKDLPDIIYGTPEYKKLAHLETNVYHFAAAKNYQQLRSFTQALTDEAGNTRSWGDYKEEAAKISQEYNGRWLKTEYDSAIGGGQMAGKWVEAEKHKDTAPWLRYDTVGDSRVRQTHRALDGVIKKVEDPFWNTWYPPNGWNCRCDVTQLLHGAETLSIDTPDDVPPMWQVNLGKEGMVFPPKHIYYDGVPPDILKRAETMRDAIYSQAYPVDGGKTKKGGSLSISTMADGNDIDYNKEKGQILADAGETVHIRPHVPQKKKYPVKNAELGLYNESQIGDFKSVQKTKTEKFVRNSIDSANKQKANIPIIVLQPDKYNKQDIWQALRGELLEAKRKKNITEVWILVETRLTKLTREQIVLGLIDLLP